MTARATVRPDGPSEPAVCLREAFAGQKPKCTSGSFEDTQPVPVTLASLRLHLRLRQPVGSRARSATMTS